jgi:uncharacterized membrane protein
MKIKGMDWNNEAARQIWEGFWVNGWGSIAGFVIALIFVFIVGMILASVVGRSLWRYVEQLIMNAPFLRRVYPYIKQITDFLLVQNSKEQLFLRVVGVEYPRKGIWAVGMVTGEGLPRLVKNFRKEYLTVLIPTSPTPFTGFVMMVPKEETIELDISIEEAMRFVISAGVITPSTKLGELEKYNQSMLEEAGKLNNQRDNQVTERTERQDSSDN